MLCTGKCDECHFGTGALECTARMDERGAGRRDVVDEIHVRILYERRIADRERIGHIAQSFGAREVRLRGRLPYALEYSRYQSCTVAGSAASASPI